MTTQKANIPTFLGVIMFIKQSILYLSYMIMQTLDWTGIKDVWTKLLFSAAETQHQSINETILTRI